MSAPRAWIFLLEGGVEDEVLLLQGKQAEASALADYGGESEHANQGERDHAALAAAVAAGRVQAQSGV